MSQQLADIFANAASKVFQSVLKLQMAPTGTKRLKGSKVKIKTVWFVLISQFVLAFMF